ncbi:MAG TPA: gamma-glutamylcyclotransferase family protein [Mycobacteriales bacterium]
MIWYVAYGSNLLAERFARYVGDVPAEQRRVTIPYARYFAKERTDRWGEGGVAFLDPDTPAETLGRAYLLDEERFAALHAAEGEWYARLLDLAPVEGVPARTFTSPVRLPDNPPGPAYADVVRRGEEETRRL